MSSPESLPEPSELFRNWVPDWQARSEAEIRRSWTPDSANNADPVVSIVCSTYHHGRWIVDALCGFLMQRTPFGVEILVYDDASTDDTADYCRAFAAAYPGLIRLEVQPENGASRGMHVFDWALSVARGRYIARCEGDDFWTDAHRLRRQVAVLDAQPGAVFCGAGAARVVTPGFAAVELHPGSGAGGSQEPSRLSATQVEASLWHLSTHLLTRELAEAWHRFRRQALPAQLKDGDFLHFAFGQGELWQLPDLVSVYRDTGRGVWTRLSDAARCRWHYESSRYLGQHLPDPLGRRNRRHLAPRYLAFWARSLAREELDLEAGRGLGLGERVRLLRGAIRHVLGQMRTEPPSTLVRALGYLVAARR